MTSLGSLFLVGVAQSKNRIFYVSMSFDSEKLRKLSTIEHFSMLSSFRAGSESESESTMG